MLQGNKFVKERKRFHVLIFSWSLMWWVKKWICNWPQNSTYHGLRVTKNCKLIRQVMEKKWKNWRFSKKLRVIPNFTSFFCKISHTHPLIWYWYQLDIFGFQYKKLIPPPALGPIFLVLTPLFLEEINLKYCYCWLLSYVI